MSAEYREKLLSLGWGRRTGQSETRPVLRDDNGKVAGYRTEHWDGRVDAVVTPPRQVIRTVSEEQ